MTNRIARAAFALTLAATALFAAPGRTHAATVGPVTSGTGWRHFGDIDHITTQPITIGFHDTTSRTHLTPYIKNAAAELSSYLGVKINVTTKTIPITYGKCLPTHTISLRYMSKPAGPDHPYRSFTGICVQNHATYSAYIFVNSDYWKPGSGIAEWHRMNIIWHEMGHAIGLDHPATCPRNSAGLQPLMCGDPYKDLRDRRFIDFDRTGFRRLVTNRAYYPLP